jgi:hypothetical protein
MEAPSFEDARRLAAWQPALGVVSVYLHFDPADRGGAWRTELRNGLTGVVESAGGAEHETRTALRMTAERVAERFANHDRDLPRAEIGFVEVAQRPARERWWAVHAPLESGGVHFGPRPLIAPLLSAIPREAARGVAIVSGERVRLLEWRPGHLELLHGWELSIFSRDWRERKAQSAPDPARAQAVSASGRDQHEERLAENRRRFLGECRRLALAVAAERRWPELLAFGPDRYVSELRSGNGSPPIVVAAEADLISAPSAELEGQIEAAVESRERERRRETIGRALDAARSGGRGALGRDETRRALEEGRVEELIIDWDGSAKPEEAEPLVRNALGSGATVMAVSGEIAAPLAEADGVAALLRY